MKQIRYTIIIFCLSLILLLSACSPAVQTTTQLKNSPLDESLSPDSRTILSVDDGELVEITAQKITKVIDGKEIEMYAYNGLVPGVALRVQQNSHIRVKFINQLDEETTVHWHGLRHDIKDDGVPDISQQPVLPGESFIYELFFPDAGVFWYHPHIREDKQQELGLAGNMLVDPISSDYYSPVNKEELLVLDDILLTNKGVVPFGEEYANYVLMGRFGNVMLINGEEKYDLQVDKGDVVRFYITNVANTRTFNFSIEGASLKVVGGDLSKYERETLVDSIVIAPAERYIVEAYFSLEGIHKIKNINPIKEYTLGTVSVSNTMTKESFVNEFSVLRVNQDVIDDINRFKQYVEKDPDYEITLTMDLAENMHGIMDDMMDEDTAIMADEDVTMINNAGDMMGGDTDGMNNDADAIPSTSGMLGVNNMMNNDEDMMGDDILIGSGMGMGDDGDHDAIEWEDVMSMMNKQFDSSQLTWILQDKNSLKENMNLDLNAKVGDVIKIRLFNDPNSMHPMQHPIHIHGQRFIVTAIDGKPVENHAWLDTVLVPMGSTVDILVDVTNPGEWMMHCHIAEHLEAGMMTTLVVKDN